MSTSQHPSILLRSRSSFPAVSLSSSSTCRTRNPCPGANRISNHPKRLHPRKASNLCLLNSTATLAFIRAKTCARPEWATCPRREPWPTCTVAANSKVACKATINSVSSRALNSNFRCEQQFRLSAVLVLPKTLPTNATASEQSEGDFRSQISPALSNLSKCVRKVNLRNCKLHSVVGVIKLEFVHSQQPRGEL